MNKCAKCGTEFEGKFCPECGTAVSGKPICPRCGNELNEGVKFCPNCGCNINEQVRSTTNTATVAVNFNWRKLLPYVPVALFVLWAVLLWAFFASTVVNGDGFFVNKVNLYQMFKDDMMSDLYSSGHALVALAVIANVYAVVLALLQFRRSARVSNIGAYASFIFYVAIIICGGVFAGKRNEFTEGFDEYNGVLPAVVISLTAVFALLQAGAMALGKFFGDKERSTQTSASQMERKPVQTPKFIVNTGKWVRAHKALTALLSITIVVTIVLCTVLPVTLGNIFRIGKVNQIKLGDTYDQVEAVLGKPYAQASDDRQYNYYSKNATKIMDQLYELSEQQDGITNFDKLEKLMAQMEKLNDQLKILDYEQITVNFANGKVSNLTLDKHVGKFDEKKVDKIYLGVKSGLLSSGYTVDLANVANDQIDEHIEFTDGSYSLGVASNVAFSDVKFGSGNYYSRSKYPTSATLSWTNQYGEQSQSVQLDSSNIDFEYSVSSSELKLSGTVLPKSFFKKFDMDSPWEGDRITSIHFDETVNYIPDIDELLTDTSGLVSIYVNSGNQYYSSQEGILFNKDKTECLYIPQSNISLLNTDWYNAQPDGLIYVGSTLWTYKGTMPSNCKLTIRQGITGIKANAFENQVNLTSVTIPNSVLTVGENAFYGCSNLQEITIPENVTRIGSNAFERCTNLVTVNWNATNCTSVGWHNSSNDYTIFKGCTNLAMVNIGENVTLIPEDAFYGCCNLKTVNIAKNSLLQTIDTSAFENCTNLQNITIPASVTYIGNYVFDGCNNLQYNMVDGVNYLGNDDNNYLVLVSVSDKNRNSYTIQLTTRFICSDAFYNCSSLQEITIPENVTSIGDNAFYNCTNLITVNWNPANCTRVGEFFGDSYDHTIFKGCTSLTTVNIGEKVTHIPSYTFYNCKMTTVNFAESGLLQYIDFSAFAYCNRLQEITIPAGVTFIDSYAFSECCNLRTVNLSEGSLLQTIGGRTFEGCSSLQEITIPAGVTFIAIYAFSDCSNLQTVYYGGTSTQWEEIQIDLYNPSLTSAKRYYYSAQKPSSNVGGYWRYVDGKPTIWKEEDQ